MKLLSKLLGRKSSKANKLIEIGAPYEFCTRCDANLTLQKGYSNDLPYWICKGCGKMLINPAIEDDSNVVWVCDQCEEMLNIQEGFTDKCGEWKCLKCGFINKIDASEIYAFDDEYRADLKNPYKGLSSETVIELLSYEEIATLGNRDNIILVRDDEQDKTYVKKLLTEYNASVYNYLLEHPVANMPKLLRVYEGNNSLIIIEEYIEGRALGDILEENNLEVSRAIEIARKLLLIVSELHKSKPPIIHRDIKPSNVILSNEDEVYLLDMNVAKWYDEEKKEDTRLLGTLRYASPEQLGFGFEASNEKSDIYSLGVLLNVMITGKFPKEEQARGEVWDVIEKCISLNVDDRYSDTELLDALDKL